MFGLQGAVQFFLGLPAAGDIFGDTHNSRHQALLIVDGISALPDPADAAVGAHDAVFGKGGDALSLVVKVRVQPGSIVRVHSLKVRSRVGV